MCPKGLSSEIAYHYTIRMNNFVEKIYYFKYDWLNIKWEYGGQFIVDGEDIESLD